MSALRAQEKEKREKEIAVCGLWSAVCGSAGPQVHQFREDMFDLIVCLRESL